VVNPLRHLLLASVLLTAVTGCSGTVANGNTAAAGPKPAGGIPIGPGPQRTYTAQPQPAAGSCRYRHEGGQPLPDPSCTPGALNPDVTQATITTTICRKGGYTSGIRPPVGITDKEKHANAVSYGYTGPLHDAEYDHLLSGAPSSGMAVWLVETVGGMPLTVFLS
jgi:hypothetical protein